MVSIQFGETAPKGVEFEIVVNGASIAAVVHHPRMPGHWMAYARPTSWRSCGMKRFKSHAGATRYVLRAIQPEAAE